MSASASPILERLILEEAVGPGIKRVSTYGMAPTRRSPVLLEAARKVARKNVRAAMATVAVSSAVIAANAALGPVRAAATAVLHLRDGRWRESLAAGRKRPAAKTAGGSAR